MKGNPGPSETLVLSVRTTKGMHLAADAHISTANRERKDARDRRPATSI